MRWYCESCGEVLYETFFVVENFLQQMNDAIEHVHGSPEIRTCASCGHVMEVPVAAP